MLTTSNSLISVFYLSTVLYIINITIFIFLFSSSNSSAKGFFVSIITVLNKICNYLLCLFIFLSLCGVPPFSSFFAKLLLLSLLLKVKSMVLIMLIVIINFMSFWFYIYNFRYVSNRLNRGLYNSYNYTPTNAIQLILFFLWSGLFINQLYTILIFLHIL